MLSWCRNHTAPKIPSPPHPPVEPPLILWWAQVMGAAREVSLAFQDLPVVLSLNHPELESMKGRLRGSTLEYQVPPPSTPTAKLSKHRLLCDQRSHTSLAGLLRQ